MKNAIVYSYHIRNPDKLLSNRCFNQMLYSIKTLRDHNKTIDVNVYIAPKEELEINLDKYKDLNINFIPFDNTEKEYGSDWYPTWLSLGYAEFLFHRWQNAYRSLREGAYDNILYLDTDTVFHNDPEILFTKYGNSEFVWAKEDNTYGTMERIGIENGMNDGQFILSKNMLKYEINSLDHLRIYTNETLAKFKGKLENDFEHFNLHWLCVQYGMYDFYKSINVPVRYFDKREVMLHIEPNHNDTSMLVLHHYYNGNAYLFIPQEYVNAYT